MDTGSSRAFTETLLVLILDPWLVVLNTLISDPDISWAVRTKIFASFLCMYIPCVQRSPANNKQIYCYTLFCCIIACHTQ